MIFNRLSDDVLKDKYFNKLFDKLISNYFISTLKNDTAIIQLSEKDLNSLCRFADILSNSEYSIHRNLALKIMSNLFLFFNSNEYYLTYLNAILSKLGNFPALNLLPEETELPLDRKLELVYKKNNQMIKNKKGQYYTDVQFRIIESISKHNFYSFSGPTSLGKTYIIKSLIRNRLEEKINQNIVIIVPTKALINELLIDLNEEFKELKHLKGLQIFSNFISEAYRGNCNLYILTPERLLSMLNENDCPTINCLFVDEAHKLGVENDQRSITLYLSIEKTLIKYKGIDLYFSAPLIENPNVFLKLYKFEQTENYYSASESPVDQNLFFIDLIEDKKRVYHPIKKEFVEWSLNNEFKSMQDVILTIGNGYSNVIYSSSVIEAVTSAVTFKEYISSSNPPKNIDKNSELEKLIMLIKETLHEDFYLIECLKYGIAFHYGGLPQSIRIKIEELFKNSQIDYLFCTSTLLEGINLPAKNLFIMQNKKGLSNMTSIDFWNLAGRAGRMTYELSGNVICLRNKSNQWTSVKVFDKKNLDLSPVVSSKIENNATKLSNIILNKTRRANTTDYKVFEYIGNIIAIDQFNTNNSLIIEDVKNKMLQEITKYYNEIEVPYEILSSSYRINILQQNSAYISVRDNDVNILSLKVKINYENCLSLLQSLHKIYIWDKYEKEFENKEVLKYYAVLMNQWMNGVSLKKIIEHSFDYKVKHKKTIFENGRDTGVLFDKHNKQHINNSINDLLNDLDQVVQFKLQNYIENYINILEYLNKSEDISDWAKFLEFGTKDKTEIALQNQGISRQAAKYLVENYVEYFNVVDEILIVNKEELRKEIHGSIFETEISKLLL